MTRIPDNLTRMGDEYLAALDRMLERAMKREIDRVSAIDPAFRRALKQALAVEDEINRRGAP